MRTSITWINDYLDPPADITEQASILTIAGFPDEGVIEAPNGEASQEVEMTSNRGDCLCHLGLAREIAVISGRSLKEPHFEAKATGPDASSLISVHNHEPDLCPLYTARVIRGVRVGPSPEWLKTRIEAIGLVPRNNLVDATNFVLFEYGQPTHVFDLSKLKGSTMNVRRARAGETMLPIGEGTTELKLRESDLVIADEERPVALAGVKGGEETAVDDDTVDIVLEAATFEPVTVRNTSRHHQVSSDSSYRFERGVHPAEVANAAERLAALILQIAGGELCDGACADGKAIPENISVSMRPHRCRAIMGIDISDERIEELLHRLELTPQRHGDRIHCTIPPRRLDLEREVDLIEEIARTHGLDKLPINENITIRAVQPQPVEEGLRAIRTTLVGLGFIEMVTHTLVSRAAATGFTSEGRSTLEVDDERAGAEPVLRPGMIPSLLRVARHNHDNGETEVQLFETAAIFDRTQNEHRERRVLGLLCDPPPQEATAQAAFGRARAAAERVLHVAGTPEVRITPADIPWLNPGAKIMSGKSEIGFIGVVDPSLASGAGHTQPVAAAEIELAPNGISSQLDVWPPESHARELPSFPPIDRDLSVVVSEDINWEMIETAIRTSGPELLDSVEYLTTFRGAKVGENLKSVTFRLRFRDDQRTLRHEEVDPQIETVRNAIRSTINGEVRG